MLYEAMRVGLFIGFVISAAGAAIFFNSRAQTGWQRTGGQVLESSIVRTFSRSDSSSTAAQYWSLSVRYGYEVDGRDYVSDGYSSTPPRSRAEGGASPSTELNELLARYPAGAEVDVYYAPKEPQRAVLEPQTAPVWMPLAAGLVILLASAAGLLLG